MFLRVISMLLAYVQSYFVLEITYQGLRKAHNTRPQARLTKFSRVSAIWPLHLGPRQREPGKVEASRDLGPRAIQFLTGRVAQALMVGRLVQIRFDVYYRFSPGLGARPICKYSLGPLALDRLVHLIITLKIQSKLLRLFLLDGQLCQISVRLSLSLDLNRPRGLGRPRLGLTLPESKAKFMLTVTIRQQAQMAMQAHYVARVKITQLPINYRSSITDRQCACTTPRPTACFLLRA